MFKLSSEFSPSGDQPQAIEQLVKGLNDGDPLQILLGATGSGKTFTIANVIQEVQRPALVMAHNKTLAAQLCQEFRTFFPENAVEYFISYYDYYQPEAYIPGRDVYIEKESDINENIERLRHRATKSLLSRPDVIVVASVSCIYGLGVPEEYAKAIINLKVGQLLNRTTFLHQLLDAHYERNDTEVNNGLFRVKGDVIDIFPSWDDMLLRVEFFGDEIERLYRVHPISGEILESVDDFQIFPATHYVVDDTEHAIEAIQKELKERVAYYESEGQLVEAQRIKQRTEFDIEMMQEMGYCKGIENYSRHLYKRKPGDATSVLLDFFPDNFITIMDESHVSVPQVRGMYEGDKSRKRNLIDFGFRLPSAYDNRPLKFDEFESRVNQMICVSATPGEYELNRIQDNNLENVDQPKVFGKYGFLNQQSLLKNKKIVEQIIRPTGLTDPIIEVISTKGQMDEFIKQAHETIQKKHRVLVTTLTKKCQKI